MTDEPATQRCDDQPPLASPELCRWLAEWSKMFVCASSWKVAIKQGLDSEYLRIWTSHQILAACGRAMDADGQVWITLGKRNFIEADPYPQHFIFEFKDGGFLHAAIACAEAVRREVGER